VKKKKNVDQRGREGEIKGKKAWRHWGGRLKKEKRTLPEGVCVLPEEGRGKISLRFLEKKGRTTISLKGRRKGERTYTAFQKRGGRKRVSLGVCHSQSTKKRKNEQKPKKLEGKKKAVYQSLCE